MELKRTPILQSIVLDSTQCQEARKKWTFSGSHKASSLYALSLQQFTKPAGFPHSLTVARNVATFCKMGLFSPLFQPGLIGLLELEVFVGWLLAIASLSQRIRTTIATGPGVLATSPEDISANRTHTQRTKIHPAQCPDYPSLTLNEINKACGWVDSESPTGHCRQSYVHEVIEVVIPDCAWHAVSVYLDHQRHKNHSVNHRGFDVLYGRVSVRIGAWMLLQFSPQQITEFLSIPAGDLEQFIEFAFVEGESIDLIDDSLELFQSALRNVLRVFFSHNPLLLRHVTFRGVKIRLKCVYQKTLERNRLRVFTVAHSLIRRGRIMDQTVTRTTPRLSWRLAELADASGLSIKFLRVQAKIGNLKTRKVGTAVIVLDEDAKAFLRGQSENNEGEDQAA